ncbi:PAS domain-containing sensor histidine kinase [Hymenobacter gummosus]|uniref:histidine kinase n=1 Tax=Hymenobacter gummosus TaxID=1776032 RepID=A0A431U716_9BACT|nr:PAS domain-containing sensor histidine kinase [Hymenobacter gummosus]RTQ52252.1 PAS domain-containing sensor histidine kinase [Hymenobacter gummosus]
MMQEYLPLFEPLLAGSEAVQFVFRVADRRVVYVSTAYEQVFGDPVAHVNDDWPRWLHRVHPDDRQLLHERLLQAGVGEVVPEVELRVAQPGGGTQWLVLTACRAQDAAGGEYLSGNVRDITATKEASLNAQKFNTKKDATLEILSHDLAAPLVLLQQLTEHLRAVSGEVGAPVQQVLDMMERTCRQGVTLIRDFVDQEFLESVNVELKWERADLGAWLITIMEEYERSEAHTHLQFRCEVPAEAVYLLLDVNKFQQVINNLLSNSIKFTHDGGQIGVRLEQRADQAVVTVWDTGVGIPERLQPVLFDKFTKARRPGLRGEKTTGLGMSVIQTIVGLHGGRITFDSTEGRGSTFVITLPLPEQKLPAEAAAQSL